MKTILSNSLMKESAQWDDQPGFVDRDVSLSPLPAYNNRGTEGDEQILKRWKNRRKRKKVPMKRIYQLGIDVPQTQKELREPLLHL